MPALAWAVGELELSFDSIFEMEQVVRVRDVTIGLTPFVTAFVVIEVLALLVRPWRGLRTSGPFGRNKLNRWSCGLGAALAFVQIWAAFTHLADTGLLPSGAARFLIAIGALAWTFALAGFAMAVSKWGLANGFAVLLTAEFLPSLFIAEPPSLNGESRLLLSYSVIAALCVGVGFLIEYGRSNSREQSVWLQAPLSGLVPVSMASSLLILPVVFSNLGLDLQPLIDELMPGTITYHAVSAILIAALTVPFAFLFHRPIRWARLLNGSSSEHEVSLTLWRSLPWTLLFTVAVGVIPGWLAVELSLPIYASGSALALLVALVLDVIHEWRARVQHGDLLSVWPEHRLYAVGPLLNALEQAAVAAHVRATRYRALLQFFGPHVPVEIMVRSTDAPKAAEVIEEYLLKVEEEAAE